MSRALNIRESEEHIASACAVRNFRITAIETLASGGTRVVLSNAVDCAQIAKLYAKKLIPGVVRRQPIRLQRAL